MSHNPALRRGAIKAFHHEINYAVRKLRGNAPAMACLLEPYTKQLQKMLNQAAPDILPKAPTVQWPDWHKRGHVQQNRMDAAAEVAAHSVPLPAEVGIPQATRMLKKQETEETALPARSDADSCSDTATWDSAPAARQHSRKPRRGRRAKARLHAQSFEQSSRAAFMEQQGEVGGASASSWNMTLTALIETLDDSLSDCGHCIESVGCSFDEQDAHGSGIDSPADELSEEAMPTCLDQGAAFAIEVCKLREEPLGVSLEEHAEAIVVSKVFVVGAIARTKLQDVSAPCIEEGDVLLSINGATDMASMMRIIFRSTNLTIECKRGPCSAVIPRALAAGSLSEDDHSNDSCRQPMEDEVEYPSLQPEGDQHSERMREMQLVDRRRVAAGIAQDDLSQLIAERIARSKRDQR